MKKNVLSAIATAIVIALSSIIFALMGVILLLVCLSAKLWHFLRELPSHAVKNVHFLFLLAKGLWALGPSLFLRVDGYQVHHIQCSLPCGVKRIGRVRGEKKLFLLKLLWNIVLFRAEGGTFLLLEEKRFPPALSILSLGKGGCVIFRALCALENHKRVWIVGEQENDEGEIVFGKVEVSLLKAIYLHISKDIWTQKEVLLSAVRYSERDTEMVRIFISSLCVAFFYEEKEDERTRINSLIKILGGYSSL